MSPADSPVLLSIEGAVATITLNRPEALNAITVEMLDELGSTLASLHDRPEIAVVVITGAGRAFSAGVDLKALAGRSLDGGAVGDLLDIPGRRVIELIEMLDAIVIAKVNGFCFTGALELALACDLIVAADEAVLGDTHAKWGIRPSWGMSQRLPALVGPAKARLLSYSAATFTGAQAQEYGIAALSSPKAELDATVVGLARDIAANSHGALMAYKDLYRAAQRLTGPEGLAYEAATTYPIDDTEERIAEFR
ncbi:MAG: enoyl-CoA hydratase/isomerase family protein [Candidatus Nanopelagicales bacterium]|jgi:enoyl-CoA hydratase/carnithine racemase